MNSEEGGSVLVDGRSGLSIWDLFDRAPTPYSLVTIQGRVVRVNAAFCRFWNLDDALLDPTVAARIDILKSPHLSMLNKKELLARLAGGEAIEPMYLQAPAMADGSGNTVRHLRLTMTGLSAAQGRITHVLVTHEDLGAVVGAQEAAENQRSLLRQIVDASLSPVFVKRYDNRYILANKSFLQVCHLQQAEGLLDSELFSPDFVEAVRRNDDRVLQTGVCVTEEEVLTIAGEPRAFLSHKFPLRRPDGTIFAMGGIATEITDRKVVEGKNAELLASARAAQEASSLKTIFLATVSHELRTPIAGVIGLADLLLEENIGALGLKYASQIQEAGRALLSIVSDILDMSKADAKKMHFETEPFSPADICTKVIALARPTAQKRHLGLEMRVDPDVPRRVLGDGLRVQQVLTNLVNNAVKFSDRGRILCSIACEGQVSAGSVQRLTYRVADQGQGIAPEDVGKLFQPFSQVDDSIARRYGGTGLGLSICKALVEGMGGSIGVQSEAGVGTEFFFELPHEVTQSVAAEVNNPSSASFKSIRGRILVVEDNEINRTVISAMLVKMGLQVDFAENGRIAVHAMAQRHDYDLILMDCQMPEMDGFEAAQRIRQITQTSSTPPIVALTANAMPGEREKCLQAGMNAYLTKPVAYGTLHAVLAEYLAGA